MWGKFQDVYQINSISRAEISGAKILTYNFWRAFSMASCNQFQTDSKETQVVAKTRRNGAWQLCRKTAADICCKCIKKLVDFLVLGAILRCVAFHYSEQWLELRSFQLDLPWMGKRFEFWDSHQKDVAKNILLDTWKKSNQRF